VLGGLTRFSLVCAPNEKFKIKIFTFSREQLDIDRNQITHLFFIKDSSRVLLKSNYEILVMNCTYKINRYKISLLILSEQISLHINFYVAFYFMISETSFDYIWVLKKLKTLYLQIKLFNFIVIIIDMKKILILIICI
jgi:hypothetical protein